MRNKIASAKSLEMQIKLRIKIRTRRAFKVWPKCR